MVLGAPGGDRAPLPPALESAAAAALGRALSISGTLAGWLAQRGFSDVEATRRFLSPRLSELTPPHAMLDRDAAAARIADAIRRRERIAVFGDYDCDGITA